MIVSHELSSKSSQNNHLNSQAANYPVIDFYPDGTYPTGSDGHPHPDNITYPTGCFFDPQYEPPCIGMPGSGCEMTMPFENATVMGSALHDAATVPKRPTPPSSKVCADTYVSHCLEGEHESVAVEGGDGMGNLLWGF